MGCELFRVDYDDAVETMNLVLLKLSSIGMRTVSAMILTVALSGCNRDSIKVQRVPKETSSTVPSGAARSAPMDFHGQMGAAMPQVKYTTPKGWEQKPPSQMRVASFNVPGANGQGADVAVIPLQAGGPEQEYINMWRQELKLAPANGDAAGKDATTVTIGPVEGKLYEFVSDSPIVDDKWRARTLVAMATREGTSWFFKMTGADDVVHDQKAEFLEFLKSISFEPTVETANPHQFLSATPSATTANPANSDRTAPAGWQQQPPTEFLLAKYVVEGDGGAKAEVNVSSLNGTGGGVFMNVNRWRGQLGLSQISEGDLTKQTSTFSAAGEQATLVDFTGKDSKTGKPSRLVGVIVPETTQTWFYKLMGDPKVVEQQKQAFIQFIQSAKRH